MAIYTKTGDKGETRVFDKKTGELTKIRKDSCHIRTIGAIDELNSFLGIVKSGFQSSGSTPGRNTYRYTQMVEEIQGNLFVINSILAGGKLSFTESNTKKLERQIDKWEGTLPVLKNFIFYGGSESASQIFYARALARRAERELISFAHEQEIPESIRTYINRLSDFLFMFARSINIENKIKESFWKVQK